MNIVVLLTELFSNSGGIQTYNKCLVKALDEISLDKDINITLLVLNDKKNDCDVNKYITSPKIKYFGFSGNKILFSLMSIIKNKNADVVFLGHLNFSLLVYFMDIRKNNRRHLIIYGIDAWEKLAYFQKMGLTLINKIITISHFTQEEFKKHNGLSNNRFIYLPCTVNPYFESNAKKVSSKKELGLPEGKMLLTVSRLEKSDDYKNIDLIIKAMPEIINEIPNSYYVIVGDGNDKDRLKQKAKDLGISKSVIFAGKVTEDLLPSYYNACDLFILPSLKEGFGIVFLEAMYFSKPCVAVNACAVPEVIEDGKTGILSEPDNIEALPKNILKLLKNESLRIQIGNNGYEKLKKEFTFKQFKHRLEEALCN